MNGPDCRYYTPVGEHVFCACPKVVYSLTKNYLTLDHAGNAIANTTCDRCPWHTSDAPPRDFIPIAAALESIKNRPRPANVAAAQAALAERLAESRPAPKFGPGTCLKLLIAELGFPLSEFTKVRCGGSCAEWIKKMNRWGVDGCREHRAEIIAHLESQKDAATWADKLKAGALAVANGLPLTIGGLVDEAIWRAVNK